MIVRRSTIKFRSIWTWADVKPLATMRKAENPSMKNLFKWNQFMKDWGYLLEVYPRKVLIWQGGRAKLVHMKMLPWEEVRDLTKTIILMTNKLMPAMILLWLYQLTRNKTTTMDMIRRNRWYTQKLQLKRREILKKMLPRHWYSRIKGSI